MDIAKGWQFKMVYDHWNGMYEREGKVTVYQDASQEEGSKVLIRWETWKTKSPTRLSMGIGSISFSFLRFWNPG